MSFGEEFVPILASHLKQNTELKNRTMRQLPLTGMKYLPSALDLPLDNKPVERSDSSNPQVARGPVLPDGISLETSPKDNTVTKGVASALSAYGISVLPHDKRPCFCLMLLCMFHANFYNDK